MESRRKIYRWVLGGIGVLLALLLVVSLLLPILINQSSVKEKIQASVSEEVGGQVRFEKIGLSLLPRPKVAIIQANLSIPGKVSGTLNSLTIYPKILPLLTLEMQLAKVQVKDPDFSINVQEERPEKSEEKLQPFSLTEIDREVRSVFASLASKTADLVVQVKNGRLNISEKERSMFQLQVDQARIDLPADGVEANITGFSLNPIGIRASTPKGQGSISQSAAHQGKESLVIKGRRLKANFNVDGDKTKGSITQLSLAYPQLDISGNLVLDAASPQLSVDLEGRKVDADSIREVALALAGDDPDLREVFDIIRGGKVSLITFHTHGSSLDDLSEWENILIKGSMLDGNIFIPEVNLDLEEVKGDAVISKGILTGDNLEARLENNRGREGILKLGLAEDDFQFHLDINVEADLSQLPPILSQVVEDEIFIKEISLIEKLNGSAMGRLVLGESLKSIEARVEISRFDLYANYQRLPYPLQVKGDQFTYDENGIGVGNVTATMGRSSLSKLSGRFDWETTPYFQIKTGKSKYSLTQIYPWLQSFKALGGHLKNLDRIKGGINISSLNMKGPLLEPKSWHLEMKGAVRDVAIDTSLFPGPIRINQGDFEAVEELKTQKILFRDAQLSMLDARFKVSGGVYDYLKGLGKVDLGLDGKMGPQVNGWVSKQIHMPSELTLRSPLSVSKAHVVWDKGGKTAFKGNLIVQNGPKLSLEVVQRPQELMINELLIQDKDSNASIALGIKEKEFALQFVGNLAESTRERLFVKSEFPKGWIQGDFQAQILFDQPMKSRARGKLTGKNIVFPYEVVAPLRIKGFHLDAEKNVINLDAADCTWGDNPVTLKGNVGFSETGLLFDMNLSIGSIDLDNILEQLDKNDKNEKDSKLFQDVPVQGIVRLKSGKFTYQTFTWSPFNANIRLNRDTVDIAITEANLCSVPTPGVVELSPQHLLLGFETVSKDQELDAALGCLLDRKGLATGKFNLQGKVEAHGKSEEIADSLKGDMTFLAKDGRIYHHRRFTMFEKMFLRLSANRAFRGRVPDLKTEGFPYDSITIKANLEAGKLRLEEAVMIGHGMTIACRGDVDLVKSMLDLEVLVAPFKNVDRIVSKTPVIRRILAGTLVTIPIKVEGDWEDPNVRTLPLSSVGSGLLGILERTVTLPAGVVQPSDSSEVAK